METPVQVTFRGFPPSPAVEAVVREQAAKFERFVAPLTACHVVIEAPHLHQKRHTYHVRIDVTLPGAELAVGRDAAPHHGHEDVYAAVNDAFSAMGRQLEDLARRRRGDVKTHEPTAEEGRVARLFPDRSYGFLSSPDGRDVYFHRNAVLHDAFDRLAVGAEVRFVEEQGEKGPQASTVELIGPPRASP